MIESLRKKIGARRVAGTILTAALLLSSSLATAGSFQVNPVNILLAPDKAATSVTMKNSDKEPVSVRVLTYRWTQSNGQDVYTETDDLIASPPIFTMAAGGTQLVRFGLRTRTAGASYRVIFEEIPREKPATTGIQVALRLNLPLYVLNKGGEANVSWKALRTEEGEVVLEAHNQGSLHAQILEISSTDTAGKKTQLSKDMGVVLPNGARHWKVGKRPELTIGTPLLLKVRTSQRETQAEVVVQGQ